MRLNVRSIILSMAIMLMTTVGFAWNCPAGQIRQQAPPGTPTTAPFYDVVEGIAFICVPIPTPPTTPSTSQTQNQNQNQNQQQTANGGSATSTSGSTSSATGGSSNSTATGGKGGNATATGGKGGNVSNSGNSSNTNTNTAQGGQGGQGGKGGSASQTQSSTSSATGNGDGNGNNSNNYASTTNIAAPKIPVNTAYAPPIIPTNPCFKGFGAGVQTQAAGATFGGGKIDGGCDAREYARYYADLLHSRTAACKMLVAQKRSKKAGVTFDDCMAQDVVVTVTTTPPVPVVEPAQPQIIVVPVASAPVPVAPVPSAVLAGTCISVSNVCKAMLDDSINWHKQNDNGTIVIYGSLTTYRTANAMRTYLNKNGVSNDYIRVEMSSKSATEVGFAHLQ